MVQKLKIVSMRKGIVLQILPTLASWNEGDVHLQPAAPFKKDHLSAHLVAGSLHKPLRPGRPKGSGTGRPGTFLSLGLCQLDQLSAHLLARITFRLTFWLRSPFGSPSGWDHLLAHLLAEITFRLTYAFRLFNDTLAF